MNRICIEKTLAFTIILLFISVSVVPSTGTVVEKKFTMPTNYNGNTLYVGGDGPGNYTRIQDAIDNASDGDTVFVYNGTYYEHVVVTKSINLIGENREITIIDGDLHGTVVTITADWVNISGFTIQNSGDPSWNAGVDLYNNNSITDNIILGNHIGICGIYSLNNSITQNIIANNFYGIFIYKSSSNNITGNNITGSVSHGILLWYNCYFNFISENEVSENMGVGIDLMFDSNHNNICRNTINNNSDGILLYDSCCNNIISRNFLTKHYFDPFRFSKAIILESSSYNTIFLNTISNNEYGIYLKESSNNNIFYHNNLVKSMRNAIDKGNNTWDDGYPSGGNYWDDYNGIDNDGDGIGDTPYNIPGGDNQDRYPLMEPFVQYPEFDVSGRGGIGLKISITNVGDIAATNVEWSVSAKGGFFGLINLSENGSLNSLDISESITLTLMPFGFGVLKISIEIDASNAEKQAFKGRFFVILFIVFPIIPLLYWFR